MYRGGLPLVGVASALLIAGLQVPGPLRSVLGARARSSAWAASATGSTSIHWPIYVILDEARTDLSGPALLGLRLAATGLVAVLSYVLIERPIRRADWRPRPTLVGAVLATSAVAVAALVVPVTIADDYWRAAPDDIAALAATASTIPPRHRSPTAQRSSRPSMPVADRARPRAPVRGRLSNPGRQRWRRSRARDDDRRSRPAVPERRRQCAGERPGRCAS